MKARLLRSAALLAAALVVASCDRPAAAPRAPAPPSAAPPPFSRTLLVVAGTNYENLARFPFFIDPVLRHQLEGKGWKIAECRWSELTAEKLAKFRVAAFLQTPNLPSGRLAEDPLMQKMQALLRGHLESGGGALIFADQFRGRIQPALDAWLKPYGLQVTPYELADPGARPFDAYPALGWVPGGRVPEGAPISGKELALPVGSELTFLLKADGAWRPIVMGPENSTAKISAAPGVESARAPWSGPTVVAAVREVGNGRLAVSGSHSSFWMLNPYHEFWDSGRLMESGGLEFLESTLDWLAGTRSDGPGGFDGQTVVDARDDRRTRLKEQKNSFPKNAKRGVIGVDPGPEAGLVAEMSAAARELGLDYLVFTAKAEDVSDPSAWKRLIEACDSASSGGFRALPGVIFPSAETGNTGLAFNLKKAWPEIPWRGESFETFVRVGVNTDWESVVAVLDPAPFPLHNKGAVTAVEATPGNAAAFVEAQAGGWPLMPIARSSAVGKEDLREAAAKNVTTLYVSRWNDMKAGDFERWNYSSTGSGTVRKFEVRADSEWEPADFSQAQVEFSADGLPEGSTVSLFCGSHLLRRVPVANGAAAFSWSGNIPGWSMFHVVGNAANGDPILFASPLAVAKVAFQNFIGSDLMNGYWYPVRQASAQDPGAVLLGGGYGVIGTSVYPQLGWGGHWQFRTLNQIGEPLGFEIGSPPGGLQRLTAGYRWKVGGGLQELAPRRLVAVNSTQAIVWKDTDTRLRREGKNASGRTMTIEEVKGVKASMRTTGYRWWDHAALLFEPQAEVAPGSPNAGKEANLATLILGGSMKEFSSLQIFGGGGQEKTLPLAGSVPLTPGMGATLGDRPMGMVSVWALDGELTLQVAESGGKPLLSLSQPATTDSHRASSFLVVLSAHSAAHATTLNTVTAALFDTASWSGSAGFMESVDLNAMRGAAGSWKDAGKTWRGRITGLDAGWDAAAVWQENGRLKWQGIPWPDPDGIAPVFFEKAPSGMAFLGHPVVASCPEILLSLVPDAKSGEWTVHAHNSGSRTVSAEIKTHPDLAGIAAPWSASAELAPGQTQTWTFQANR